MTDMQDEYTDRLSDYLDGELDAAARADVDAHLRVCGECVSALDELRAVAAKARALPIVPPRNDLWPGVEARLEPRNLRPFRARMTRRVSFTLPQLVAAGLALMVLSGGAVWLSRIGGRATSLPPVVAVEAPSPAPNAAPVVFADPRYDDAIADLQQALEAGRSKLDPQTVRVLEANLKAIDDAIEQSRRALAEDPMNVYLNSHLAEAKKRKLALLRRASALVSTQG
jgi:tetratricopeptide (TPR) repeat protein